MDRKKLLRKTKPDLIDMLETLGVEASENSRKEELVDLILTHDLASKPRRAEKKSAEKKTPEKEEKKAKPARAKKEAKRKTPAAVSREKQKVEETKYSTEIELPAAQPEAFAYVAPPREAPAEQPQLPPYPTTLPHSYGSDRLVAMVRDPYWLFTYWEVTPATLKRVRQKLGKEADHSKMALRVYDITGVPFTGENANSFFDIEVGGGADNWYINTGRPNRSYCVDIGLLTPEGAYHTLARSNPVHTPRMSMSEEVDESWMSLEEEFERIYALSGGFQIGHGSIELREMMEKQLRMQLASEAVGSLFSMAAIPEKERGFWFMVHTELIVYGATQPDAAVTIQGKPVALRPDGTFQVRFALPDGKQVIPVSARSADGQEERTITPTVTRATRVEEPVVKD